MLNKKLILHLQILEEKEINAFLNYLAHHNQKKPQLAIDLLEYLKAYFSNKKQDESKLSANFIAQKLFKSSLQRANDTASELYAKLQEWSAFRYLENSEQLKNYFIVCDLATRHSLYDEFDNESKKFVAGIDNSQLKDVDSLFLAFATTMSHYEHPQTNKLTIKNTLLPEAYERLEKFYLITKLRIGIELFIRSTILKEKNQNMIEDWEQHLAKAARSNDPLVQLYIKFYYALEKETLSHNSFDELYQAFFALQCPLSDQDASFFTLSLVKICNGFIQNGSQNYYLKIYELYIYGLRQGFLCPNDTISSTTFQNIAITLLKGEILENLDQFMATYSTKIYLKERQATIDIIAAYRAFFLKDFNEVISVLNKIDNRSNNIKPRIYLLQISAYFELYLQNQDSSLLLSRIEAFHSFIQSSKELDKNKLLPYQNFLNSVQNLFKYKPGKKAEKLIETIKSKKPIHSQDWLLDIASRIVASK